MWYDPPSGWRYRFPKPYIPLPGEELKDTLLRDGYPQSEIDTGMDQHVRFIGTKDEISGLADGVLPGSICGRNDTSVSTDETVCMHHG